MHNADSNSTSANEEASNALSVDEMVVLIKELNSAEARETALARLRQIVTVEARERLYQALVAVFLDNSFDFSDEADIAEISHTIARGGIHAVEIKIKRMLDDSTIFEERDVISYLLGFQCDGPSSRALSALIEDTKNSEENIGYDDGLCLSAIESLVRHRTPETQEVLLGLLDSGLLCHRLTAAKALQYFPEPAVCRRMLDVLHADGTEAELCEAIETTLSTFPEQLTSFLARSLKKREQVQHQSPDEFIGRLVHYESASGIADEILNLPLPNQCNVTLAMLNHPHPNVLGCAFAVLGINEYLTSPELRQSLMIILRTNPNAKFRKSATEQLYRYRDDESKRMLISIMKHDPNTEIREAAARVLSESFGFTR